MTTEFNYGIPVAITGKFYRVDPISGAQTLTDTTAVCRVINTTTKVELDSTVTRVSLGTYQVILDVSTPPFSKKSPCAIYQVGWTSSGALKTASDWSYFTIVPSPYGP